MNIKKVKNTFEKKSSKKGWKKSKKKYSEPFRRRSNDLKWFDRQVPTTISNGHKMQISMEIQIFFTKISFILIFTSICCSFDELISFYLWIYFPFRYFSPVALLALAKFRFYIWIHNDCLWFFSILIFELICIH